MSTLRPGDIRHAVDDFLAGEWAVNSDCFALCVAQSAARTSLAREVERQAIRLHSHDPSIKLEIWDAESLSDRLKNLPQIVEDFFGTAWLEQFLPGVIEGVLEEQRSRLQTTRARDVVVVVVDWAPELLRAELTAFAQEDPEGYRLLHDQVGTPPEIGLVVNAITNPAYALREGGDPRIWRLLALIAEQSGCWDEASRAWEESAARADHFDRAGALVGAAVAAAVGGNNARHDELFAEAMELAPDHPRVRLQMVDEEDPPDVILNSLAGVESDDPGVGSLLAARRALAALRVPDLEQARAHVQRAESLNRDAAVVQSITVNVTIQQARLDLSEGRQVSVGELHDAFDSAVRIRARLLKQRRFQEAVRLLMLSVDALSMLGEYGRAASQLRQASEEELRVPDAGEVLGDAALRGLAFEEALLVTDHAPASPTVDRIRADAQLHLHRPHERDGALATLDRLIDEGGSEAELAAYSRLVSSVEAPNIPWSSAAADVLRARGYVKPVTAVHAYYLGRKGDFAAAADVLRPFADQEWAAVAELRLALMRGDKEWLAQSAARVLAFGPPDAVRVECGRALLNSGASDRAREAVISVARRSDGAKTTRADAYALLVRLIGEILGDWETAFKLHTEWTEVRPEDPRASAWAPTVASRRLDARRRAKT